MRVLHLTAKDSRQLLRDAKSALFLIVMPSVFTLFFGFILGSFGGNQDTRLQIGVLNRDVDSIVSRQLVALLESSDVVRPQALAEDQGADLSELVDKGKLAAALTIPEGWGQRLLTGEQVPLAVVADQGTSGQTAVMALQGVVQRLLGMAQIAQLSAAAMAEQAAFPDEAARLAYQEEAIQLAGVDWANAPVEIAVQHSGQIEDNTAPSGYEQASPGMIVQFAIYGLMPAGMVLLLERKSGTLRRLLTTPLTKGQVIAGKTLAMFLVVFVQQVILVLVGQCALGVDYLRAPLALLLVMVGVAAWSSTMGLFISAVSRSEEQVIMWSLIAMFILAAMGGAWFPLEITGQTFAAIGHVLPSAWAMDGFQNLIVRGQGLRSVLLPSGVLIGYAGLFLGLAIWRFRFD